MRPTHSSEAWFVFLLRSLPALVLGLIVTFSADHSATLGLLTLGAFAVVTGLVVLSAVVFRLDDSPRAPRLVQASGALLLGAAAFVFVSGGQLALTLLVVAFCLVTGGIEFALGWRARRTDFAARDHMFVGGLTLALACAVLVVPPDLQQQFIGPDKVERALTSSIVVVGLLGAYWIVAGVYLVIAALSLKWAAGSPSDLSVATPDDGDASPLKNGA